MKKLLIIFISIVWVSTSLTAQASNLNTGKVDSTTITIWHNYTDLPLVKLTQIFEQYTADHPGTTINLYRPADLIAELDAAIPSGTGPDIILWANDNIGVQVLENHIIDLNQLGITAGWLSSNYEPEAAEGVQYRDKIWALPISLEGIALVYNKSLVTAEYLPANPLDFAALRVKAQNFLTTKGIPLICNQGFAGGDSYHVAPVYFGFGVPAYIDENGNVFANTPEAISAGTWLASLPLLSPAQQDYGSCETALLNDQVGMWWTGPWAIAALDDHDFSYGIFSMGKPFVGIKIGMITVNARERGNAPTALDILETLTNSVNSKTLALALKIIPANTAALYDPFVQALPTVSGFGAAMSIGIPMSPSPYSVCQWAPLSDAEMAIWFGTMTPTDALGIAQAQIKACINKLQPHIYLPFIKKN